MLPFTEEIATNNASDDNGSSPKAETSDDTRIKLPPITELLGWAGRASPKPTYSFNPSQPLALPGLCHPHPRTDLEDYDSKFSPADGLFEGMPIKIVPKAWDSNHKGLGPHCNETQQEPESKDMPTPLPAVKRQRELDESDEIDQDIFKYRTADGTPQVAIRKSRTPPDPGDPRYYPQYPYFALFAILELEKPKKGTKETTLGQAGKLTLTTATLPDAAVLSRDSHRSLPATILRRLLIFPHAAKRLLRLQLRSVPGLSNRIPSRSNDRRERSPPSIMKPAMTRKSSAFAMRLPKV